MAIGDLCMTPGCKGYAVAEVAMKGRKVWKCQRCLERANPGAYRSRQVAESKTGEINDRIMAVLVDNPDRFMSNVEVAAAAGVEDTTLVARCLSNLYDRGHIIRIEAKREGKLEKGQKSTVFKYRIPGEKLTSNKPLRRDGAAAALANPPRATKTAKPVVAQNTGSDASEASEHLQAEGVAVATEPPPAPVVIADKPAGGDDLRGYAKQLASERDDAFARIAKLAAENEHLINGRDELARQLAKALEEIETLKAGVAGAEARVQDLVTGDVTITITIKKG